MKSRILAFAISLLAFMACNKTDDNNPVIEKDPPNYFPMTTGSYWVYNTYKIDSMGNEELRPSKQRGKFESIFGFGKSSNIIASLNLDLRRYSSL